MPCDTSGGLPPRTAEARFGALERRLETTWWLPFTLSSLPATADFAILNLVAASALALSSVTIGGVRQLDIGQLCGCAAGYVD